MNEITEQFNKLIDFGFEVEQEEGMFSFYLYDYKGLNFAFYYRPTFENKAFYFSGDLYFNPDTCEYDEQCWENLDADWAIQLIKDFVPEGKVLKTYNVSFNFSTFLGLEEVNDKIKYPFGSLGLKDLEIEEVKND